MTSKRKLYREDEKLFFLHSYYQSGMSKYAFCRAHGIAISMTEDYKPTDNAVAERINGIIKAESSHSRGRFNDIGHARNVIARYIHFYNHRRPHMSIGCLSKEGFLCGVRR